MTGRQKIADWLKGRKDSSVSFVIEKLLQKRLEPYGRLLAFELNSRQHAATIKMLPAGEIEPVTLNVEEYILSDSAEGVFLTIRLVNTSRPWLTKLLDEFVVGKAFQIPDKYRSAVKMLL